MNNEFLVRLVSSIILLPLVIFIIIKGSIYFNFLLFLCFSISVYEWFKMSKKKINKFIGLFFLVISFMSIYQLRFNVDDGLFYLLLILAICIFTDLGGYFFGKIIKGPRLTKISPNKTYSGMIGSFILPVIFIYYFYSTNSFSFNFEIFICIILISLISQLGDIIISYFKRISSLKDTGNVIPGHGGLLDRIDGMIFVFPLSYLFILLIGIDFI